MNISVIIEIYNERSCLEECLNSVINQTLKNIEIICIDCSCDNSVVETLENCKCHNINIKLIKNENKCMSYARNKAINLAIGKYLYFLDSNGYITLD
jgi:glycosyltransferase involved in cell wall biosynthesis